MFSPIFERTYSLGDEFEAVRERAARVLGKYVDYTDVFSFNEAERNLTFRSERIIPPPTTSRPRVLLLFSNPHPRSVHQGMFLSLNTHGRENPFWGVMSDAGWLFTSPEQRQPAQLAQICSSVAYEGAFEFLFYCYYSFPTKYPEDIARIFGRDYFRNVIEPEALDEFTKTVEETSVDAVVTFNKGVFNLVGGEPVEQYIERLQAGEVIRSAVQGVGRPLPIFLTYPTGWRYHPQHRELRRASLECIRVAMIGE